MTLLRPDGAGAASRSRPAVVSTRFPQRLTAAFLGAALLTPAAVASEFTARLNPWSRQQTMEGFGGSVVGWHPEGTYDVEDTARVLVRDLGVTTLRVDMRYFALNDSWATRRQRPLAEDSSAYTTPVWLTGDLNVDAPKFDMRASQMKIYGEFAEAMHRNRIDEFDVIGSMWSPPVWLKGQEKSFFDGTPLFVDGDPNRPKLSYFNGDNQIGGSLRDDPASLAQFGRYVSGFVEAWEREWGVPMKAVSFANEPHLSGLPYTHTVVDPTTYRKALVAVNRQLDASGQRDVLLFGPEAVGVGATTEPVVQWFTWHLLSEVLEDPEAREALDRIAVHGYDATGIGADEASSIMWNQFRDGRSEWRFNDKYGNPQGWEGLVWDGAAATGKPTWMTEGSGQVNTWLRSPEGTKGALDVAKDIHTAIVEGGVSSFIYWMLSEAEPEVRQFALYEAGDLRGPKYVAFKHYSRYIRPGAERIALAGNDEAAGMLLSAYVHDANQTLTLVAINDSAEERELLVDLSQFLGTGLADAFAVYQSDEVARFKRGGDVRPTFAGVVRLVLPAWSVTTLVTAEEAARQVIPEPGAAALVALPLLLLRRRRSPARGM